MSVTLWISARREPILERRNAANGEKVVRMPAVLTICCFDPSDLVIDGIRRPSARLAAM